MIRRRNLAIWVFICVLLLTIVSTLWANEETIRYNVYQSTSDVSDAEPDPNGPIILDPEIKTFHDPNSYFIYASANVYDPQGPNDIATVKAIDANGNEFTLKFQYNFDYQRSGYYATYYWGGHSYGITQPPFGNTQIVAIDQSGNSDTVSENLTNVVEQLPTMLLPKENQVISETQPLFNWADITDEHSPITYGISVSHLDWVLIWEAKNLVESEALFNFNGLAREMLQDGLSYRWVLRASDTFGNVSYNSGSFEIAAPIIPENLISLENDDLRIELDPNSPRVYRYVSKSNDEVIYGNTINTQFPAQIFYQRALHDVKPFIVGVTQEQESDRVCYHMRTVVEPNLGVDFDLCYELDENNVKVVFSNIAEDNPEDCRLVLVRPPSLLTVRADQHGAKLVFPETQGRLIDVENANPGYANINLEPGGHDRGGWDRPLFASMVYHDNLMGIAHYGHLDMMLWTRVIDHDSEGKLATISMNFNYRYAPTDFETAAFIDVFDSETTELTVVLTFLADYDGDLDVDWMDGAKFLRDQVKAIPDPRYLSSFIIKTDSSVINWPTDYLRLFRRLYHLTDHNKIHSYLIHYNPRVNALFGIEEDLWPHWSLEELIEVFHTAEESYNTFLSFHDLYTDYYPGTPGYDPNLRVIRHDGKPWLSAWLIPGSDEACFADPYDYATQVGIDRVKKTLQRYPIKESHHIDALSLYLPKDHSPNSPSSRERNRRGVQLIVNEFDKFGVNVTSEGLNGHFVESGMGWFVGIPWRFSSSLPFGNQESIPLMAFIYHGKSLYGLYELLYYHQLPPDQATVYTFLENLLLGASSGSHISWYNLDIDKFYLIDLPWMALNQRFMEDYQEQGSCRRITYDPDTFVDVDYKQDTYTVQVDGRIIAQNYTTCFPKTDRRFLIFSRDEKEISVNLPPEWLNEERHIIELHVLTEEGVGSSIPFQISGIDLTFHAEANTPYRLDLFILKE